VSSFPMVFFVWNAILRSVCLKKFLKYEVSLPSYVKMAHLGGAEFRIHQLGWFRGVGFNGKGVVL